MSVKLSERLRERFTFYNEDDEEEMNQSDAVLVSEVEALERDHEIVEKLRGEKMLLEEDMKNQIRVIEEDNKEYKRGRDLGEVNTDREYAASLWEHYCASKLVLSTINRLLGVSGEEKPISAELTFEEKYPTDFHYKPSEMMKKIREEAK